MRTFSSYGPVNTDLHYYAPRKELIDFGYKQLIGNNPQSGGHYITVWAPRQTGKSWALREILFRLKNDKNFNAVKVNLEVLKTEKNVGNVLAYIRRHVARGLDKKIEEADTPDKFQEFFSKQNLEKPLILILDEFDSLDAEAISIIVGVFRNIYTVRQDQTDRPTQERDYLLHGVALL